MYRSLHAYDKSHFNEVNEPLFHLGVGQHHILYKTLPGNRGREHAYIGDGWGGWRSVVVGLNRFRAVHMYGELCFDKADKPLYLRGYPLNFS